MAEPAPLREVHRAGLLVVRPPALPARARRGARSIAVADEPVAVVPAAPYRGIRPFRYADHRIFFARTDETQQLASLVAVYRGVFLYGDSGSGKSSLVNAGLLPRARSLGYEPVRVRVQPRAGQELVVVPIEVSDDGSKLLPCGLTEGADRSRHAVLSIAEFERRVHAVRDERRTLLVFDQFEEILTLFESDEADAMRRALAEMLDRLLREPLPVKVVFAFREDYLGRVKQLMAARPELVDQALRLGPPSADSLRTIIRGPFERFPGRYERELAPQLAERLSALLADRFGTGEVSLSEVQTVCLRLWRSSDPDALLDEKGVQGLLEDELGEALDAFEPDVRVAAIALLSQLVTAAGTRNVIAEEDLLQRVAKEESGLPPALVQEALQRLERDSRLVRREQRRELDLYEITSEFLVPWITRRRDELRVAQERRRERQRLRIMVVIAIGAVTFAVVSMIAFWALVQRDRAAREASEATSLALAASSVEPLRTRPDVALRLAYEAYRERPRAEASAAVVRALLANRESDLRAVLSSREAVSDVAFAPAGDLVASAGHDGLIRLRDPRTGRQLTSLRGHAGGVYDLGFSPDGRTLASGGEDGRIRLWDVRAGRALATLDGHAGPILGVRYSPSGGLIASTGDDGTVRLWDAATLRRSGAPLRAPGGPIFDVAFDASGEALAAGCADGAVRVWDVATRKPTAPPLRGHRGPVYAVAFTPDERVVSAGRDGRVQIRAPRPGAKTARFAGRTDTIGDLAVSDDGSTLVTAGDDTVIRLWDLSSNRLLGRLRGHTSDVTGIAISPDGETLASSSIDNTMRIWNLNARGHRGRLSGHAGSVRAVAFSRDGKLLASAGGDGRIRLRDAATGDTFGRLEHDGGAVNAVAFDDGGTRVASGGNDRTIRLWNPASRRELAVLRPRGGPVSAVAFNRAGTLLASADTTGRVILWPRPGYTRNPLRTDIAGAVAGLAFSPDGRLLAMAAADRTIRIWSVAGPRELARSAGHSGPVTDVAFSPDGRRLASASEDSTIRLWDAPRLRPRGRLTGHAGPVNSVAWSRDGKQVASASADRTVRLWDPDALTLLGRLTGHTGAVNAVAFSAGSDALASGAADSSVRLWNDVLWRDAAALTKLVCTRRGEGLDRSEWAQFAPGIDYRSGCP